MYKVLIIDDEQPTREAIKILGKWSEIGVTEIIEAENGIVGILMIEKEKPDIVIIDMKMPKMNGVEFLKEVEERTLDVVCIVVSGYSDYEFTRQAIKSNVVDYILKPINRYELNNALINAVKNIKEKTQKMDQSINSNIMLNISIPALKEKVFNSIIESHLDEVDEKYLEIINIPRKSRYFGCAVINVLNFYYVIKERYINSVDLFYYGITNVIREVFNKYFQCFSFKNPKLENELIIVAWKDTETDTRDNFINLFYELTVKVTRKIKEVFRSKVVSSVGDITEDFYMINDSYKSAKKLIDSKNIFDTNDVLTILNLKEVIYKTYSIIEKMYIIENAVKNKDKKYLKVILNDFLDNIQTAHYLSLKDALRIQNEAILMMCDIAARKLAIENNAPQILSLSDALNMNHTFYISTYDDFRNNLNDIIFYFYNEIIKFYGCTKDFNINFIKDYIDKNYSQKISISFFAKKYYLSKGYIMKLFKQEFKIGIYEYVQKIRMEKAKEFLIDSKIKIQDISQMVGYSDHNYFSKAFKSYYGISPSTYRDTKIK